MERQFAFFNSTTITSMGLFPVLTSVCSVPDAFAGSQYDLPVSQTWVSDDPSSLHNFHCPSHECSDYSRMIVPMQR